MIIGPQELNIVKHFVAEVERRAEARMLKTNKLEGMHYASMMELLGEWEAAINASPAERAKQRPSDYATLPDSEQWIIDEKLGLLDWDGSDPRSPPDPV
jgi:hypothetical protein